MSEIINAVKCGICGEKVKAHDPDDHECKPKKYCEKWEENIKHVNAPIFLQHARSGGKYHFEGEQFTYCPWCGKELPCG